MKDQDFESVQEASTMPKELVALDELKDLLPPLSEEEYAALEMSLKEHGCLFDLIVWKDIIVDGHHRYEICRKYEIPFGVKHIEFKSIDDAKIWAWEHQEGRRNLTPYKRAEIALKLKDAIAAKAKERQRASGGDRKSVAAKSVPQNFSCPINNKETRQELAQVAKLSHTTLAKAEYIAEHADEETKDKLRKGEKGTSIHKEYTRLKSEMSIPQENGPMVPNKPVTGDPLYDELNGVIAPCPNRHIKTFPKTTLKLIPQENPHVLLGNLFDHFREGFVREMIVMAIEMFAAYQSKEIALDIMAELNEKFSRENIYKIPDAKSANP